MLEVADKCPWIEANQWFKQHPSIIVCNRSKVSILVSGWLSSILDILKQCRWEGFDHKCAGAKLQPISTHETEQGANNTWLLARGNKMQIKWRNKPKSHSYIFLFFFSCSSQQSTMQTIRKVCFHWKDTQLQHGHASFPIFISHVCFHHKMWPPVRRVQGFEKSCSVVAPAADQL